MGISGTLEVVLESAEGIKTRDTIYEGKKHVWNEKFKFNVEYPGGEDHPQDKLIFRVMDKHKISEDEFGEDGIAKGFEGNQLAVLAQLVERVAFNHVVVGSSPTDGILESMKGKEMTQEDVGNHLNPIVFGCRRDAEILAGIGLAELPVSGRHVPGGGGAVVTARDPEGQGLAHKDGVGLPVLAPVAAHGHPLGVGAFDAHADDIPCTRDVGDQDQVEVSEAVDRESDPSLLSAWDPTRKGNPRESKTTTDPTQSLLSSFNYSSSYLIQLLAIT
ncbi:hypothetical protein RJ640_014423 [Escallonia rubra]|uniref:C2 domain-containing protein n=1 Tax=Escallonia rubra TaxID=112253 RepID=A0AA88QZD3_9ASTE|nr:hypothetical protein RJ640_014423 [Escallonia rubra]